MLSKTWGPIIDWIAIVWVIFIVHPADAAAVQPDHAAELQLRAHRGAVVIGFAGIWCAVSARKWFKGPKVQGTAEELAEIERDLNVI